MHCIKCGNKLNSKDKFCTKCGEPVKQESKNISASKIWLRTHWFKVCGVLLVIALLVCGVAYFKNIEANNRKAEQDKMIAEIAAQKENTCLNLANKFKTDTLKKSTDSTYYSYYVYEFKYNRNTDKCIVAYVESSNGSGFLGNTRDYEITDLFSGEKILSSFILSPGKDMSDEQDVFDKAKNKAFTEVVTSTPIKKL